MRKCIWCADHFNPLGVMTVRIEVIHWIKEIVCVHMRGLDSCLFALVISCTLYGHFLKVSNP